MEPEWGDFGASWTANRRREAEGGREGEDNKLSGDERGLLVSRLIANPDKRINPRTHWIDR